MLAWSLLLVAVLALAGCGAGNDAADTPEQVERPDNGTAVDESRQGDFVYRLIVHPPDEQAEGKPTLSAELEYVGDKDEATIYHAASPFYFFLKETTRDYDLGYMMNQPLISTKMKKGEAIRETYKGSGGYSDKDSQAYIDFVNELVKNGFPSGQYEAAGKADFYTQEDGNKQEYTIAGKVAFTVN